MTTLAEHAHSVADFPVWMWAVWAAVSAVSVWSIWAAIKATFFPGETEADHVKRSILDDDAPGAGAGPAHPGAPSA